MKPRGRSDHCMERLEVGISFCEITERAIHLEADLEVSVSVVDVAEKRFVTTHVVVIDRLLQQRDRPGHQKISRFSSLAELVKAKTGVQEPGAGIGCGVTELPADPKGQSPSLLAH